VVDRPKERGVLLVVAALLILATVLACGGDLVALADVRLRSAWLVGAALAAQVFVVSLFPGSLDALHRPLHLASYGMLGAFLWRNRRLPGMVVVAAGGVANAAAIVANGGVMPATSSALASAGMPAEKVGEFANSAAVDGAALSWLGDVFAVPASWPLSNVFSIGDLLIAAGLAFGLHMLARSRPALAASRLRAAYRPGPVSRRPPAKTDQA
jgi:Family of unknown function (DUF5317)